MRPRLLLVPAPVPGTASLGPLALALGQTGWPVQVLADAEEPWIDPGQEAVLVLHGAALGEVGPRLDQVQALGGWVVALVLLDAALTPASAPPVEVPVGYLRLAGAAGGAGDDALAASADVAAARGWPCRHAPGDLGAPGVRRVVGPLLRLLGDLEVAGGLTGAGHR